MNTVMGQVKGGITPDVLLRFSTKNYNCSQNVSFRVIWVKRRQITSGSETCAAKDLSNSLLEVLDSAYRGPFKNRVHCKYVKYVYLIINKGESTLHTKNTLSVILLTNISNQSLVYFNH